MSEGKRRFDFSCLVGGRSRMDMGVVAQGDRDLFKRGLDYFTTTFWRMPFATTM